MADFNRDTAGSDDEQDRDAVARRLPWVVDARRLFDAAPSDPPGGSERVTASGDSRQAYAADPHD